MCIRDSISITPLTKKQRPGHQPLHPALAYPAPAPVQTTGATAGSGAGVQDFLNKTVDFAASDSAMKKEDIAKVGEGVQLLPMTAGEIVLAYNLPGSPKGLKLPRDVYSNIFLGKITRWNDPKIAAANPDIKLPDLPISVVVRADSSGTTAVFTKHLATINAEFNKALGEGLSLIHI